MTTLTDEVRTKVASVEMYETQTWAPTQSWSGALGKRVVDITGALLGLLLLSPIILGVVIAILIDSGWPVIFAQKRVGRDGRLFTVYKFRSMTKDAEKRLADVMGHNHHNDGPIFKWKEDPRVTRVGRVLRKTSLDELPQLLNVLLGNMSLVGPRPPLQSEVEKYEPRPAQAPEREAGHDGLMAGERPERSRLCRYGQA
jgi:lipopolysaccharide/colanic/teichoic acid biosynthesis glycosyltransferase